MNNPSEQITTTAAPNPYLTSTGDLIIPHNAEAKYRHWQGGQTVVATLRELNAPPEVMGWYVRELDVEKAQGKAAG